MEIASRIKVPRKLCFPPLFFSVFFFAKGGLKRLKVWVIELQLKARLLSLLMSAIRFGFKLRHISVIDPTAAGMLAQIINHVKAATAGGVGGGGKPAKMSFMDVYFLSV